MSEGVIHLEQGEYPSLLKQITEPPNKLYYMGTLQTYKYCLSIIGSRDISSYGIKVLHHLFKYLNKQLTIVSGFSNGVDTYAHILALRHNMKTIAVLPHGFDCVPSHKSRLYNQVLNNKGLVLSEYPRGHMPYKWTYLKRNRIVASISKATIVVEAKKNSGTTHTACLANSFGREVFVIPNGIFDLNFDGSFDLLGNFGRILTRVNTINDLYNLGTNKPLID